MNSLFLIILAALCLPVSAAEQWITFPDARLEVLGLPWFKENSPDLWRLSKSAKDKVPMAVWNRAVAPDGGRICFISDTSRLGIKVQLLQRSNKPCFFEAYFGDKLAGSARATNAGESELVVFENKGRRKKEITLYLPNNQEVRVLAISLDASATLKKSPAFAAKLPIVCYGSSVLQGTGAAHPSKTYPAILARQLKRDFINLGFGGAGKAEPVVVHLVNQLEACCYIFDLGKSYGNQGIEPYAKMLEAVRAAHPAVPVFCITPIFSIKETKEPEYQQRSEHLRALMRQAVSQRRKAGDKLVFTIEGIELFGEADKEFFNDPTHPNDAGNERLAGRLAPKIEMVLSGKHKSQ